MRRWQCFFRFFEHYKSCYKAHRHEKEVERYQERGPRRKGETKAYRLMVPTDCSVCGMTLSSKNTHHEHMEVSLSNTEVYRMVQLDLTPGIAARLLKMRLLLAEKAFLEAL